MVIIARYDFYMRMNFLASCIDAAEVRASGCGVYKSKYCRTIVKLKRAKAPAETSGDNITF